MPEELWSAPSKHEAEKLSMPSYGEWARNMEILLRKKYLWEIAKGAEKMPENAASEERKKFEKRQNEAASKIGSHSGALGLPRNMRAKTPAGMRSKLRKFFNGRNMA